MAPGTEFARNFCAGIGPLQLGVVLVLYIVISAICSIVGHMWDIIGECHFFSVLSSLSSSFSLRHLLNVIRHSGDFDYLDLYNWVKDIWSEIRLVQNNRTTKNCLCLAVQQITITNTLRQLIKNPVKRLLYALLPWFHTNVDSNWEITDSLSPACSSSTDPIPGRGFGEKNMEIGGMDR